MKDVFAPGCALYLYKPHYIQKMMELLNTEGEIPEYDTCCHHKPVVSEPTRIINVCAGCDRRYGSLYDDVSTISFWEKIADSSDFPFPDYNGMTMSIQDACPTRKNTKVHDSIRKLLNRMNIVVIEPERTRENALCCGDSFYGKIPKVEVIEQMKKRAEQMPVQDVVVYCVSCIKAMHNGGRQPRYILDLLFGEFTLAGTTDPDDWHDQINKFIAEH